MANNGAHKIPSKSENFHSKQSGNFSLEKVKKPGLTVMVSPDTNQMTPFKPTYHWHPGQHRIPGGVFPMPPAASDLCTKLPPPKCFEGPYVMLDHVMKALANANLSAILDNNGEIINSVKMLPKCSLNEV